MAESSWQAAEEDVLFDESEAYNLDKFVKFHGNYVHSEFFIRIQTRIAYFL